MSDKPEKPGTGKKKRIVLIVGILLVLAAVGGGLAWYFLHSGGEQTETAAMPGDMSGFGENVITASGSTSVGMQEESFTLDFIDTELVIEEVYLSNSDEVEAGTAILKLTDESVEAARRELEEKSIQADLDYREALLDGEEEKITAKQTLDESLVNGNYASYTMEEDLKEYADTIADLQEQIEEAQELVDEYTASAESDYYYTYYEVGEKKQEFEETFAALMQLYEEWDVATLEDHYTAGTIGGTSSAGASAGGGMQGGASKTSDKLTVYEMLDEEVQENEAAYEQAQEDYETAKKKAESSLAQAQSNLQLLQLELEEAQVNYDKQQVTSQNDYEMTLSDSSTAQETYDREIDRIEEEIRVALNTKEDSEADLAEFEATIGDGCLYTQSAGTVMMVAVREDSSLTGDSMVLAYSNPESVTVTASVSQENIASLEVGEEAIVMVSDYGTFDGKITSINPVSSSTGSSITYSVTVELSGDVSTLSQNLSSVVYFGVTQADTERNAENETEIAE